MIGRRGVATGAMCFLLALCATADDRKKPVEDPDSKKGSPGIQQPAAAPDADWTLRPAWAKGSNLTQVGYLLDTVGSTQRVSGRMLGLTAVRKGRFLVAKTDSNLAVLDAESFKVLQQYDLKNLLLTRDAAGNVRPGFIHLPVAKEQRLQGLPEGLWRPDERPAPGKPKDAGFARSETIAADFAKLGAAGAEKKYANCKILVQGRVELLHETADFVSFQVGACEIYCKSSKENLALFTRLPGHEVCFKGVALGFRAGRLIVADAQPETDSQRGTMSGIAATPDGAGVCVSVQSGIVRCDVGEDGALSLAKFASIPLSQQEAAGIDAAYLKKHGSDPLGVGITPDGSKAYVAIAIGNAVAEVDLASGKVLRRFPVGVCPYGVVVARDGRSVFVSNFGGSLPRRGDATESSGGSRVAVDARSVALRGSVSVIDLARGKVAGEIPTRIHPEAMVLSPDGKRLYVVDASGDGVSEISVAERKVVRFLSTKPRADMPCGSLANGIAISADGRTLFTANAGNNAVALIHLDEAAPAAPFAFIPAGGFPGSLCVLGDQLFIGNVLGFRGDLQKVSIPKDPAQLAAMTATAEKSFHLTEILRVQARTAAASAAPLKPVPLKLGDPSPIKHVVYIIKENKKFDQVLGDLGRGNCDPKLVEFGRATTPNTHGLAEDFVILDNYYCNGVLSCDGHQWAIQGVTSPYREKDWGNLRCTYDFGNDPLCFAGCGFIWDHAIRMGLSFRNFGEAGYGESPKKSTWVDNFKAWQDGSWPAKFRSKINNETINRYSEPGYPGWAMEIPDQVRAEVFLRALAGYEKAGTMPDLITLYLPNDHTQHGKKGWPTPRAYVADNDFATGRIVEALSKSSFWKDTVIFINEDDPQTGADHVDGHRSFCLLAGPYVKRGGQVISRFYNQTSVLHTISRILGMPPLNQTVAASPLMHECFTDTPDLSAFTLRKNEVPLDELNGQTSVSKTAAALAPLTEKLDFSAPDRIDKDALMFSRWVWATVHGERPFPVRFTGSHGKGLAALRLKFAPKSRDDDDE